MRPGEGRKGERALLDERLREGRRLQRDDDLDIPRVGDRSQAEREPEDE